MGVGIAWLSSLVCRKLCEDICEVRNRWMMGGACFESIRSSSESRVVACFRSGVRLGFLRRMRWREQMVCGTIKYGKDRIAEVA